MEDKRMKAKKLKRSSSQSRGRRPDLSGRNQSISRTTVILEALATSPSTGLRLVDVVRITGLSKATVHRLLAGLAECGLVDQHLETNCYFVGVRILSWAVTAGEFFGLVRVSEGAIHRLAQFTSDTIYLSARSGDDALCIHCCEGSHPIKTLTLNVGDRRPLGVSAGGLALLAFLSDPEIARVLEAQEAAKVALPIDRATLSKMVSEARRAGFAYYDAPVFHGTEVVTGMAGIAVPIRGPEGRPFAALAVAAIESRLQAAQRKSIGAQLQIEARSIEALLARKAR